MNPGHIKMIGMVLTKMANHYQVDHIYISLTGEMKLKLKRDGYIFLIKSIYEEFEIHIIF